MKPWGSYFWLGWAGVFGAVGVALGAFGAHGLRPILPLQMMTIYQTAVQYHLWHTLALAGCGLAMAIFPERSGRLAWSAAFFAAGILLFAGSLYALALTGVPALGAITPLGGVCLIAGWGAFALAFLRQPPQRVQSSSTK